MGIIYSPLLLITASLEAREARRIRWNRRRGEDDDDDVQEWEHVAHEVDYDLDDAWRVSVAETAPNVETDPCSLEVGKLKEQVAELSGLVKSLAEKGNREA